MPLYVFPVHKFNPGVIQAAPVARVIGGGESLTGQQDVIEADGGGRWQITFGDITLRTREQIKLWNAWEQHLSGGAVPILVPAWSLTAAPRPIIGSGLGRPSQIHADDDFFPTQVRFGSPLMVAVLTSSAALRATVLTIELTQGARLEGGETFGVGSRSYRIKRVRSRSGQQAEVEIVPPLREALSSGVSLNFDWPVVRCRAALGQELTPGLSFGRFATVSVSFVEDFGDA